MKKGLNEFGRERILRLADGANRSEYVIVELRKLLTSKYNYEENLRVISILRNRGYHMVADYLGDEI